MGPVLVGDRLTVAIGGPEVDLGDPLDAEAGGQIDQQTQIDGMAAMERHRFQQRAATAELTGQRLDQQVELGEQCRDQRPGHQLGDPPAALPVLSAVAGRSP